MIESEATSTGHHRHGTTPQAPREAPPLLQDRQPVDRQALKEDPAARPGLGETPTPANLDN